MEQQQVQTETSIDTVDSTANSLPHDSSSNPSNKRNKKEPVYHPRALAKWAELEKRGFIQKTCKK